MYRDDTTDLSTYVLWGVLFSLLVHVALFAVFSTRQPQHFDTPVYVDIDIEPPQHGKTPSRAIVETPDIKSSPEAPDNAKFLSEKNTAVQKEEIKRGDIDAGASVGKEGPQSPTQKSAPKQEPQSATPPERERPTLQKQQPQQKLSASDLSLDPKTLAHDFVANQRSKVNDNPLDLNKMQPLSEYHPFSRPYGSGARVLGNQGSNDYLPNLPDGDITMLNTKADRFAVFVRRVATQVFTEMRSEGWDVLRGGDIRAATQFTIVHAILSPKGELLSASLESASGSNRFDQLVLASARKGANDPNPPVGARANDGNIHFIFQSRSWVEGVSDARTGAPIERRWVLLGTGLE